MLLVHNVLKCEVFSKVMTIMSLVLNSQLEQFSVDVTQKAISLLFLYEHE